MASCLLLLAIYAGLSLLNDPRGYLGTDTGGKIATLDVMTDRGTLDPDVGYWAERWDPEGDLHPLHFTAHIADRWVNATTLPALYAAWPLYRIGGYRLALLLPMLGSVMCALAARALAHRLRPDQGWTAFWIVGLASPIAVYALDFWEHSLGVAAVAWAIVALVSLLDGGRWWLAGIAGVSVGVAATMRTEAIIYGFVAFAVVGVAATARRWPVGRLASCAAIGFAGVVAPLLLNLALETATVGSGIRGERAAGTAAGAGIGVGTRLEEGLFTTFGLRADAPGVLLGLALVGLIVVAVWRGDRDPRFAGVALAGALLIVVVRLVDGLGFVPGLFVATPLAAIALLVRDSGPPRMLVAIALVSIPIVVAFQPTGGAAPQWAGRYLLTSGLLLGVVGVSLALPPLLPGVRWTVVAIAAGITAAGVAWLGVRSHDVARASATLTRRPEPVIVSTVAHLAREAGAFYGKTRWLTAVGAEELVRASEVLRAANVDRVAVVALADADPSRLPGYRRVSAGRLRLFADVDLIVSSWELGSVAEQAFSY